MRVSIWYRAELMSPPKSGYYLAFRGFGMGGTDESHPTDYLYFDSKKGKWYDYETDVNSMHDSSIHFVYYWTDADPHGWLEKDPPRSQLRQMKVLNNVALADAWKKVEEAYAQYKMIETLVK